jgi:hypothetical protein
VFQVSQGRHVPKEYLSGGKGRGAVLDMRSSIDVGFVPLFLIWKMTPKGSGQFAGTPMSSAYGDRTLNNQDNTEEDCVGNTTAEPHRLGWVMNYLLGSLASVLPLQGAKPHRRECETTQVLVVLYRKTLCVITRQASPTRTFPLEMTSAQHVPSNPARTNDGDAWGLTP